MLRELINAVHFWNLVLICILILTSLSYLSALASAKFFMRDVDQEHRSLANSLIGILSAGYTVLLAFVIINTWNYMLKTKYDVAREADSLAVIMRNTAVFPPEVGKRIARATQAYVILVRTEEWKDMREGRDSKKAWGALENLLMVLQKIEPKTTLEKIYYSQLLRETNLVLDARRNRLTRVNSIIPIQLSGSLVIGAFALVIILGLIRGESGFLNITPLLFFAIVLGFNLAIALSFDYPYSGDISVSNQLFYEGILSTFKDPPS